jgi:hypothetical protein
MTNFQFGFLVGFFLGACIMLIALVITLLYLGEWGEQPPLAWEKAPRETRGDSLAPSNITTKGP